MVIDEILNIRWKCIYPLYFDKKRSITEGRRVPQGQSITNPTCQHLIFACEGLNLPISVEVRSFCRNIF
jgi:signal recognition particle subunit SRP19